MPARRSDADLQHKPFQARYALDAMLRFYVAKNLLDLRAADVVPSRKKDVRRMRLEKLE